MSLAQKVQDLVEQGKAETLATRRHIHQNPELSFEEFNTCKYVADKLRAIGIDEVEEGVANTGVVGLIKGKNPDSKIIALRADMDALPILEANDVPYKSQNEGVMHACGHDVHTSSLLGATSIMNTLKGEFEGTIKLIFQPGEERLPGGASIMIKEGVLENPKPDNIVGQHVMPLIDAGKVGFRSGMYMASADEVFLTVKGKGGHAAMPEFFVDPVIITAQILIALQQVVSRSASPKVPSVLSFGKVQANGATNIIPDDVHVEGTFRTMDEEWRMKAHEHIRSIAENVAKGFGAECDVDIRVGYPFLKNDEVLTPILRGYAAEYLGEENIIDLDLWMAAEDFSYYTQTTDACFYRLGIRNEAKGINSGLHTPTFNIDESALEIGVGLMAYMALKQMGA